MSIQPGGVELSIRDDVVVGTPQIGSDVTKDLESEPDGDTGDE